MEFIVDVARVQEAVKNIGIIAKINTTDTAGRILIKTNEDNSVIFLANNDINAITVVIDNVQIVDRGEVSVLFSKIKNFIGSFVAWNEEFGAKEFKFRTVNNKLNIKVDNVFKDKRKSKGSLTLETYPAVMMVLPKPFKDTTFILNSDTVKSAINKVVYAINNTELRTHLQGLCLSFDEDSIHFAGTDGLLLSDYRINNTSTIKKGKFVFKYDFIMALRRAIANDVQVFFEIKERSVCVKFDNICIYGALVIGQDYPEYKPLFEKFEYVVELNKEIMLSGLVSVLGNLVSDDNNRITITINNKQFKFFNDYVEYVYEDVVNFDGDFVVDINGIFLKQTLDAITDDRIMFKFTDDKNWLIFDSATNQDQKSLITYIKRREVDSNNDD